MSRIFAQRRRTWRAATATAAVVATGAMLLAGSTTASAHPGMPSAVFDQDIVGWASVRDRTSAQFAADFASWRDKGYLVVDIDIEVQGRQQRIGAVFQQNTDGRAWRSLRNLTDAQFKTEWQKAKDEGKRLVDQETYLLGGTRYYAGVWVQNVEHLGWASYRNLTSAQFSEKFRQQKAAGRMPVDVDSYNTGAGMRYAAAWVDNKEDLSWKLWRGLTSAQFSEKFAAYQGSYRMLAFDSVKDGGTQRYAGVWVENENGRAWRERRNLSARGYANWWHRYNDEGFRLVSFDRYDTANGPRYAGIWRQNSERPLWSLKDEVNTRVQSELDTHDVPGISVAVFQNGQARYLRGFGHADIDAGVWMDCKHVGSIASVSKAVAGALTMRMVEQGQVDLDDDTRDWVPTMPEHHTHDLGDLLSNRGCVRHYQSGQDGFGNQSYATALAASQQFWDDDLVCTVGQYSYSTHGYTLLAAALEAADGDDVKDLVRKKLTNPFRLGTLAPQTLSDPSVRRMSIYTDNDQKVSIPNNDWKVLGGGIDSNAYDLGRFGAKLAAGQILSQDSLDTMWTVPNANSTYAHGWSTGTDDVHQVVAKDGSWTGNLAYLRIYPDDGIVVAVMMNDRSGNQSATQLGRDIGGIILDELDN